MENNKMRCHFSIIFEKSGKFLAFWFFLVLSQTDEIVSIITEPDFSIQDFKIIFPVCAGLLLLFLLIMGYQFMLWRKTFIYLDNNTFVFEQNTLNRKKNTVGIANISNINLEQNLFERLVGTYRLKLDTDSFSTAKNTDVSIVLSAKKAEDLKAEILSHMNKDTLSPETKDTAPEAPFASFGEILSHCFFSIPTGLLVLAVLFVAGLPPFLYFTETSLSELLYSEGNLSLFGSFLPLFLLVMGYIYQMIKQLLSFYHFSCFRRENDLIIRYGFFRKQDFTVPIERINALRIIQPPLARIAGRMQAQIICIGLGDGENEKTQLALCMKKDSFYKHLQDLLPEFMTEWAEPVRKLPKGAGITYFLSTLLYTLCFSIPIFSITFTFVLDMKNRYILGVIYGIILLLILLYRFFHYFCLGIGFGTKQITICDGSLKKEISLVPYGKIQFVTLNESPLRRLFQIATGSINILAPPGSNVLGLPFLNQQQILELKTKCLL